MKLNKGHLELINETSKFIIDWCDDFDGMDHLLTLPEKEFDEIIKSNGKSNCIEFPFPGPDDYYVFELEEYLALTGELKAIEIVDKSLVKTKLLRYYIVKANDPNETYIVSNHTDIKPLKNNGVEINLVDESIFIGLAATKLKEYDAENWGTSHQYLAIEMKYEHEKDILNPNQEIELLNSYIFEIADSAGIALIRSEIKNPVPDIEERKEETAEDVQTLRDLERYNEGMRNFVSAVQVRDLDLKFLSFYKVLEYFAPFALTKEANELMRKKLDAPKSAFEEADFIRSIFELANSTKERFNDEALIQATFNTCFDFVGLFKVLPQSIQKKIKKQVDVKDINYSSAQQKITTAISIAANVICKTRNKVVHAKTNFTKTGEEIGYKEMTALNAFMKAACSQSIRWYNRQA